MLKNINITNKTFAAYYLTRTEKKIISALSKHPEGLTIKSLVELTGKTRLTLLHSLNKLLFRQLVSKNENKKAHIWKMYAQEFPNSRLVREATLEEAYAILSKDIHGKVYAIQGSQAVKDEVARWRNKTDVIKKVHVSQKLKSTVVEALASEDILPLLKNLSPELKRSHFGRATSAHILPKGSLGAPYELIFTTSLVCCLYPKEDYAIIIHNKSLAQILVAIYPLLCTNASKINLGEIYK